MRSPFVIAPGIVSDDTTFATPGRWVDGSNMRPWRGSMQTIGGWNKYFGTALTGICRNVRAWTNIAGYTNIAFGTNSALQVYLGGTLSDITPVGLAAGPVHGAGGPGFGAGDYGEGDYGEGNPDEYFPRTWSLDNWGENLVASPRNRTLYIWENNPASVATEVTNAPDNISFMLVTPERQVLALGCNEETSGTFNPLCIRGSDLGDYSTWATSAANNAFEHILAGSGRIVAGKVIGSYVAVWTDSGLYLGQFIGDAAQAYRFDPVASNCGLVGPNAVQVINQTAYWVTPDYQFYSWAPGMQPQILPCPIRNAFKDNMAAGQFEKIAATSNGQFGEVWWFYPDSRDGNECSRYVALNTLTGEWFRGEMARTACTDSGPTRNPIFVSDDSYVYSHEDGKSADGGALSWTLTAADQYINEAGDFLMVRGIWPDFEDQSGPVSLTLDLKKYPQADSFSTKGPYSLYAGRSKCDFMASGRVAAMTFSGSSSPAFARFGKPIFDVVKTGSE